MNLSVRLRYAPRCGVEDAMVSRLGHLLPGSPTTGHPWRGNNREPPLSPERVRATTLAPKRSVSTRRARPRAIVSGGGCSSAACGGPSGRVAPHESPFFSPACVKIEAIFHRSLRGDCIGPVPSAPPALSPRVARVTGPERCAYRDFRGESRASSSRTRPGDAATRRASLARGPLRLGKSTLNRLLSATAQNHPRLQEARARWETTTLTPSRPE